MIKRDLFGGQDSQAKIAGATVAGDDSGPVNTFNNRGVVPASAATIDLLRSFHWVSLAPCSQFVAQSILVGLSVCVAIDAAFSPRFRSLLSSMMPRTRIGKMLFVIRGLPLTATLNGDGVIINSVLALVCLGARLGFWAGTGATPGLSSGGSLGICFYTCRYLYAVLLVVFSLVCLVAGAAPYLAFARSSIRPIESIHRKGLLALAAKFGFLGYDGFSHYVTSIQVA